MSELTDKFREPGLILIVDPVNVQEISENDKSKYHLGPVVGLNDIEDIAKAVCDDASLRKRSWLVIGQKSQLPRIQGLTSLFKLMRFIPHMVCAFLDLDDDSKFLRDMIRELRFPVPTFRILGWKRFNYDNWGCLKKLSMIANELADPDSLLGILTRKWTEWDWSKKNDRSGARFWCFSDLHVGSADAGRFNRLAWLRSEICDVGDAELPDGVLLLGDVFDRGNCEEHLIDENDPSKAEDSPVNTFIQILSEEMDKSLSHEGNGILVIPGDHDFRKRSTGYFTGSFEKWVKERGQSANLISAYHGRLDERPKRLRMHNGGKGKSLSVKHVLLENSSTSFRSRESIAIIRPCGKHIKVPLRLILLSSFDPSINEPYNSKKLRAGTISKSAKKNFKHFLASSFETDSSVALNVVGMHHALDPYSMRLSGSTSATEIRGLGDFRQALHVLPEFTKCESIGTLFLHGHTHIFHLSTLIGRKNVIHVGVPPIARTNPYEPMGFAGFSVVQLDEQWYALCISRYRIESDGRHNTHGSIFLPETLWVLKIAVNDKGWITEIDDIAVLFTGRYDRELRVATIDNLHKDSIEKLHERFSG